MLEEVLEDARMAFEAHRKVAEEHRKIEEARQLQEFIACFKKDR
jgi:hypothetical protein